MNTVHLQSNKTWQQKEDKHSAENAHNEKRNEAEWSSDCLKFKTIRYAFYANNFDLPVWLVNSSSKWRKAVPKWQKCWLSLRSICAENRTIWWLNEMLNSNLSNFHKMVWKSKVIFPIFPQNPSILYPQMEIRWHFYAKSMQNVIINW